MSDETTSATRVRTCLWFEKGGLEAARFWHALVADGGRESMCGWLKDRWGVSWQIVPDLLPKLLNNDDRAAADRAMQAMLKMNKIDIATVERAFRGR